MSGYEERDARSRGKGVVHEIEGEDEEARDREGGYCSWNFHRGCFIACFANDIKNIGHSMNENW